MRSFLFIVFLIPGFLSAQDYIRIENQSYSGFTKETVPAFKVEVDRVAKKDFMDHWENYLEHETRLKVERTDNEIRLKKVVFKKLGSTRLDVYMHFEDMDNGTRCFVAFSDSVKGFISPEDPEYGVGLKRIIMEETNKVFIKTKAKDVEKEEEYLEKVEKEYEKLRDKENGLNKDILKKEQKIDKLKNDIVINEGVLEELTTELASKRSDINALGANTPDEVRKNAEKELKNSEKKRDKLRKQIDKDKQEIYDLEKDIRDVRYEIEKLQSEIEFQHKIVEEQRKLVLDLREEINQLNR